MINRNLFVALLFGLLMMTSSAFVVPSPQRSLSRPALVRTFADQSSKDIDVETVNFRPKNTFGPMAAAAIMTSWVAPLVVWAVENDVPDDYEYGAVDAPISIAWVAGVFVILTALLPIALQGGEEAFEEMKERDSGEWGKRTPDVLNRRNKRR